MNILVVHEVDWLKKVVFEIHNIAEQMSLLGHRVIAVDYEDTWEKSGFFDLGSLRTRKFDAVSRTIPGGSVTLRHPGIIRIPGLSRLSAAFTHYREIHKILREENIDVILLYSVPTNGLQTLYLAKRYGIPVVFRSIDILYRMVRYPVLRPATRFMESRVYANVDKIIAIAPRYTSYVVGMGAPREKVKLVLMPVDTNLFHPADEKKELREKWGLGTNDAVVVFIGTLFHFSGLDRFIRTFPQVLSQVPKAKLLIVGDGPQRSGLETIISELRLEKFVIITGFQPYETMPQYINLAEVCINTFLDTPETEDIFPGKIIQYLACGCATVATPLRGITALAKPESAGIVYAGLDEMAAEVVKLLKSPEYRKRMGKDGLAYVRETHSYDRIARQFEGELLDSIATKKTELEAGRR